MSADTGGGHRASAESLAKQFLIHFPGSTYDLLDVWTEDGVLPYRTLVDSYKHLSAHPRQWQFLYHLSNSRPWELAMDWHSTKWCEKRIRRRIASYNPDVVVSVHPAMNNAPMIATRKLSRALGKHIPFFTVVTDLGSGHCTWFQKTVDKMYLASERLYRLAKRRGRTPDENIVMSGLPIRHDFAVQAQAMIDRNTEQGKIYQKQMKAALGIKDDRPMILLMGGGEGVGSLSTIVDEVYSSLVQHGVDATICVICGRNEKLQNNLKERDWAGVLAQEHKVRKRRFLSRLFGSRRRSREIQASLERGAAHEDDPQARLGNVDVLGLGFITNMAEYMVAADILVTKAGPGTIAEAAAVGLPVMLTSFLPGQEAGNVDFVLEKGFGDYCDDPVAIGKEVAYWLQDPGTLTALSRKAQEAGHPQAAADIVTDIGSITHTWLALNGGHQSQDMSPPQRTVLVTGGAGYIGSHTCLELLDHADGIYKVVVIDTLDNSSEESLNRVRKLTSTSDDRLVFRKCDIRDQSTLTKVLDEFPDISSCVHFAGLKAVGESVEKPLMYYNCNIGGTVNLLELLSERGVKKFVFSSSATVYGEPEMLPLVETARLTATNPYGRTKLFIEEILRDCHAADPEWNTLILRYFNPIGAHASGEIGEDPQGIPNNLMPYIAQVCVGRREKLSVFGNDYDTPDGTGVRDYIHVVDLARGHVAALDKLYAKELGCRAVNLGTGQGVSVLDLVEGMGNATGKPVPYEFAPRRPGDVATVYADASLAADLLDWNANLGVDDMCEDTWRWQSTNPYGYQQVEELQEQTN